MYEQIKNIVIIGCGGLATEIKYLIDVINKDNPQWNLLGFIVDDGWEKQKDDKIIDGYKVIGTIEDLNNTNEDIFAITAIGTPQYIKEAVEKIYNPLIKFANLIHPSVEINTIDIGVGNIISFSSFISCNVKIENFNFFNTMCSVGHDTVIGSFNVFNPRCQISGFAYIGNVNFWGMNSSIIERKKVGNNNVIGASSFVIRNIKNNESLFGVPATKQ